MNAQNIKMKPVVATNMAMSPAADQMTHEMQYKSGDDLENSAKVTKIDWGVHIPLMYAVTKFEIWKHLVQPFMRYHVNKKWDVRTDAAEYKVPRSALRRGTIKV